MSEILTDRNMAWLEEEERRGERGKGRERRERNRSCNIGSDSPVEITLTFSDSG